MTSSDDAPNTPPAENTVSTGGAVESVLALPTDLAGAQTFGRFRWQAKIALQRWLGTLAAADAPNAVAWARRDCCCSGCCANCQTSAGSDGGHDQPFGGA